MENFICSICMYMSCVMGEGQQNMSSIGLNASSQARRRSIVPSCVEAMLKSRKAGSWISPWSIHRGPKHISIPKTKNTFHPWSETNCSLLSHYYPYNIQQFQENHHPHSVLLTLTSFRGLELELLGLMAGSCPATQKESGNHQKVFKRMVFQPFGSIW